MIFSKYAPNTITIMPRKLWAEGISFRIKYEKSIVKIGVMLSNGTVWLMPERWTAFTYKVLAKQNKRLVKVIRMKKDGDEILIPLNMKIIAKKGNAKPTLSKVKDTGSICFSLTMIVFSIELVNAAASASAIPTMFFHWTVQRKLYKQYKSMHMPHDSCIFSVFIQLLQKKALH